MQATIRWLMKIEVARTEIDAFDERLRALRKNGDGE